MISHSGFQLVSALEHVGDTGRELSQGLEEAGGTAGTGLGWRPIAPGQPPSAERPSGIPRRLSPPRLTNPTSQLRSKGPPRLKTWSPTGYGANGSYYKRAPGAWERRRGWAGAADTVLSKARAIHCPHGGGGLGAHLRAPHLAVITAPWLASVQTAPRMGTWVPG